MYETLKHICTNRKSTRKFSEQEVSPETIEKILEIAKTSPYASGRKNWEIVVVDNRQTIQTLADCVRNHCNKFSSEMKEEFRESFLQYAKSFTFFENAPVLLVLTFRVTPIMTYMLGSKSNDILHWERDNYTKSISCVAMLVLLAAESLGLGACYMTGPLVAQNEIMELINAKKGREIGAIIPIGYSK